MRDARDTTGERGHTAGAVQDANLETASAVELSLNSEQKKNLFTGPAAQGFPKVHDKTRPDNRGRIKGTLCVKTKFDIEAQQYIADGKSPLTFLLNIVWDDEIPLTYRASAAIAALPYCHRKLPETIELTDFRTLTNDQLQQLIASGQKKKDTGDANVGS